MKQTEFWREKDGLHGPSIQFFLYFITRKILGH